MWDGELAQKKNISIKSKLFFSHSSKLEIRHVEMVLNDQKWNNMIKRQKNMLFFSMWMHEIVDRFSTSDDNESNGKRIELKQ